MNEGPVDRIIRVIAGIAVLIIASFLTGGALQIILYIVGAILLLTGVVGFCGLYKILHISTRK